MCTQNGMTRDTVQHWFSPETPRLLFCALPIGDKLGHLSRIYRNNSLSSWWFQPLVGENYIDGWIGGLSLNLVGGWATQLKNIFVKLDDFPGDRGENSKNLWKKTPQLFMHDPSIRISDSVRELSISGCIHERHFIQPKLRPFQEVGELSTGQGHQQTSQRPM